jgi:hypothetical protein
VMPLLLLLLLLLQTFLLPWCKTLSWRQAHTILLTVKQTRGRVCARALRGLGPPRTQHWHLQGWGAGGGGG